MGKLGLILFVAIFGVNFVCAAHWISGWSEGALDGEPSDGKSVFLWNPLVGFFDNRSDIIGPSGASGVSGIYMIDCEMLSSGCSVGDILSVKIFGERYISWIVNVTITGAGFDVPGNLSLNSPPIVSLIFPIDYGYSNSSVDFNCSFLDYDNNVEKVELWGNWSGDWNKEGETSNGLEDEYVLFNKNLAQGEYEWNCYVEDDLGIGDWAFSNNSFFVDTTSPVISGVTSVDNVCGFGSVPVECEISDNIEVGEVIVRTTSPSYFLSNYSASWISGDIYRANVDLDEVGDWNIECFGFDEVGNGDYFYGDSVKVGSMNPEISFIGGVDFSKSPEVEGEILNLSVNVSNSGCVGSGNFIIGFFDDDFNFANETVFVGVDMFEEVFVDWIVDIGSSEILAYADLEDVLDEDNESNNEVIGFAYLKAWQGIYGNVSMGIVLAGENEKIGDWGNSDEFAGNVFVVDSESNIEWNNLQAFGRDKLGEISGGDFGEIDSLLGMSSYNDSISSLFGDSEFENFSIFGEDIENVPVVDSGENGNFVTGLLWDMSDSSDLEYDYFEKEDVVFAAKINRGHAGTYGTYDYEILVPSKLRDYDTDDEEKVYLYYDLQ